MIDLHAFQNRGPPPAPWSRLRRAVVCKNKTAARIAPVRLTGPWPKAPSLPEGRRFFCRLSLHARHGTARGGPPASCSIRRGRLSLYARHGTARREPPASCSIRRGRLSLYARHGTARREPPASHSIRRACTGYLHAETILYIINIFSSQVSSKFCWRRPAPHAGAGTYFRYEAKVSKDSPKDTFGIRLGNSS